MEVLFKNKKEVSQQWLSYIENEARSLSESATEFEIENYMDREVLNPQMTEFLAASGAEFVADITDESSEPMVLNAIEMTNALSGPIFSRFRKFKRKIRKLFCEAATDIEADWNGIIQAVLLALIPAFSGDLPALVLPIVVGLVALLMKKGYGAVCPV